MVNTLLVTLVMLSNTESGKVQEVYKLLLPLKSWLNGQQDKLDSMKPAAVLNTPLSDQISENEVRVTSRHGNQYIKYCPKT